MHVVRSRRLQLVPVTRFNADVLWELLQEPDMRTFQDLPDLTKAQFVRTVATRPAQLAPGIGGRFEWLLYPAADAAPIGWVSLRLGDAPPTRGEVGYSIVADSRSRGFASEAVAALATMVYCETNVDMLRAYCVPENLPSRAVLRRCGFSEDGMVEHGATVAGHSVNVLRHVLTRAAWVALDPTDRSATGS